jgi:nucleoside-diphosphate-sugar epimerase
MTDLGGPVLVTGATGMIGAAVRTELEHRGARVHASAVDLLDGAATRTLMAEVRPAALVHCAWGSSTGAAVQSAEHARWGDAGAELLSAFGRSGGRSALVAGSSAEYEWAAPLLDEERTPIAPATAYGRAKHELHQRGREIAEAFGFTLAWPRIFFVYGPREHAERLVPSVARALLSGRLAPCTDGRQQRDYQYVDDVAGQLVSLLLARCDQPVNVGSGRATAVRELVEAVAAEIGRPELIEFGALPRRPHDPDRLIADVTRLHRLIGKNERMSLAEGVRRTVAWWRAQNP